MELVPIPEGGRRYTARRRVRLGDVTPGGRLRLDALARYLQDVATDDADDAGLDDDRSAWVVRRTVLDLTRLPRYGDEVTLTTFCSGTGRRWAERRTSVTGSAARVEAASLWVHLDAATGKPLPLPPTFLDRHGEAAGGRAVDARLRHPPPPPEAERRPWALRASDFDVLGHVNNAAYWDAVEDAIARACAGRAPTGAEVEFRTPVRPGAAVELVSEAGAEMLRLWLVSDGAVAGSARVDLAGWQPRSAS